MNRIIKNQSKKNEKLFRGVGKREKNEKEKQ